MIQPDKNIRLQISNELESELRKLYSVGTYTDKKIIVKILNSIYEYHYKQICDLIRGVNIKNLASYLLFEYETLDTQNESIGTNLVMYKETILYLLDLLVEKRGYESSSITYFFENEFISRLWIHAENSIQYSNASNFTYRIPHFKTNLEIFPPNSEYFLEHSLINRDNDSLAEHQVNVKQNNILIDKYLQGNDLNEEIHVYLKQEGLKSFEETFQLTYYDFFSILTDYANSVQKIEAPNKIPCISDRHMAGLSKDLNISESNIRILFSGLTLKKENFKDRQREIWKYSQQERSRKRSFIEINYGGKKWSLYSPKMVNNRINMLAEDLVLSPLDRIPTEWKDENLQEELAKINTKFGKWFENKTKELLEAINVFGYKPGNKLRINSSDCITITTSIGPPDFIGYSKFDNSLIVLECKLLDCVFEPNGIYGEYVKFLSEDNKKNYVKKFESKISWIVKNKQAVIDAIEYNCKIKIPDNCKVIHYCFVTYYPTTIRYFYDNIPTPTLFELMDSYSKIKEWPFKHGTVI
jgi:hypothetical protein